MRSNKSKKTTEETSEADRQFVRDHADSVLSLLCKFKSQELPNADEPYHHEAEIAAGLRQFESWMKDIRDPSDQKK